MLAGAATSKILPLFIQQTWLAFLFRVRKKNPSNDADGFNLQVRLLIAIGRSRAIVPLNVYSNSHVTRARTI